MGPYCKFCDRRCFVYPPAKAKPERIAAMEGRSLIFATCDAGKAHDRKALGFNIDDLREESLTLDDELVRMAESDA